jgi:hypothetical protein
VERVSYWQSVAVIALGGILGVMYSVPLRRALVTGSDLAYPEGVAAAEVLKVGAGVVAPRKTPRACARVMGTVGGALYPVLAKLKLVSESAETTMRLGAGATTWSGSLSLMLLGVGHLVGLTVGLAMLAGADQLCGPAARVDSRRPAAGHGTGELCRIGVSPQGALCGRRRHRHCRSVDAAEGDRPGAGGIRDALAADAKRRAGGGFAGLELTERDLPIGIVGAVIALAAVPIALLLAGFAGTLGWGTLLAALAYVLVQG